MKQKVIYNTPHIMNKLFDLDCRGMVEQTYYWNQSDEKRKEIFYKWGLDKYRIKGDKYD